MKEKSNKASFYIIFRDLLKNFWVIMMAAVIGFLSVTIYAQNFRTKEYTASATLVVSAKSTSYANAYAALSTASSMAGVLKEVFESDILMNEVGKDIGSVSRGASVSANVISGTNLLVLSVTAEDPRAAYTVCSSVLEHYNGISDYLFSNVVLEVVAEPQIPTKASNVFHINLIRCLAAVGCAIVTAGIIVLMCVTRKTLKNAEIEDEVDGVCFGVIPHERKRKTFRTFFGKVHKAVLINGPLCSFHFEESNRKLADSLRYVMDEKGHKTVLISSVAENEGKSTISTNLAIALGNMGKHVLMIDVDFRKPALYKILEQSEGSQRKDLVAYIDGRCEMKSIIKKNAFPNVYVALNYGAKKKSTSYIRSERLSDFIRWAETVFDYIILDSSPIAVGTDVQLITDIADCSMIIVRHDYVRLAHINEAIGEVKEGKAEFIGYAVNDYRGFNSRLIGQSAYGYGNYGSYGYDNIVSDQIEE